LTADLEQFLAETRRAVDAVLDRWATCAAAEHDGNVGAAIAYSLRVPGKRLRPALVVAAYRAVGGTGNPVELGAAVEVVHTYSLVHDDLPCMDDDDLRRGHPTTHRAFDVAAATEAGFRMVPLSARVLAAGARSLGLDPRITGRMAIELYRGAGVTGMIAGQMLDLEAEGRAVAKAEVEAIHCAKTGALIAASVVLGGLAGGAGDPQIAALRAYGEGVGIAFQIVDDVLDATETSAHLGKTAGKDAAQRKASYAAYGIEAALADAGRRVSDAVDLLPAAYIDSRLLGPLARLMVERKS
jgi:geranylgeranyl diphosphate synthase type II